MATPPFADADAVIDQARASLGLAPGTPETAAWGEIAPRACERGYERILLLLGPRGYGPAAVAQWRGRTTYNTAYAVAFLFRFKSFAAAYDTKSNSDELKALDDELTDPLLVLFDDAGAVIEPDAAVSSTGATSGRLEHFDADLRRVRHDRFGHW